MSWSWKSLTRFFKKQVNLKRSVLQWWAVNCNVDAVKILVREGVDVHYKDEVMLPNFCNSQQQTKRIKTIRIESENIAVHTKALFPWTVLANVPQSSTFFSAYDLTRRRGRLLSGLRGDRNIVTIDAFGSRQSKWINVPKYACSCVISSATGIYESLLPSFSCRLSDAAMHEMLCTSENQYSNVLWNRLARLRWTMQVDLEDIAKNSSGSLVVLCPFLLDTA